MSRAKTRLYDLKSSYVQPFVYLKPITITAARTRFTLSADRTSGVWVVVAFVANLVQLAVLQCKRPFVKGFEAYGARCLGIQYGVDFADFAIAVLETCGAHKPVLFVVAHWFE